MTVRDGVKTRALPEMASPLLRVQRARMVARATEVSMNRTDRSRPATRGCRSRPLQEGHKVGDFPRRELAVPRMAMAAEHVFERLCPAVVKERFAEADTEQRRGVGPLVADLVGQPDVVGTGRGIKGRLRALGALVG